ncbi:hypothetical protein ACFOY2_35825 [Nonomuraea purpurea]|uniref:Type II toxin-antitoxin system VapC family toxin n=1 Tax=Nonomuraea purpurea TaxID=1849276 RepID=A0ABV8GFD4_9ACTN
MIVIDSSALVEALAGDAPAKERGSFEQATTPTGRPVTVLRM